MQRNEGLMVDRQDSKRMIHTTETVRMKGPECESPRARQSSRNHVIGIRHTILVDWAKAKAGPGKQAKVNPANSSWLESHS